MPSQSLFVGGKEAATATGGEAFAMPGFDGSSIFSISVSTITIGAALIIGFYAFQAMI
jgi:hypothetical protein